MTTRNSWPQPPLQDWPTNLLAATICAATADELLAQHRALVETVDVVEWRLDSLDDPQSALPRLAERPGPTIVTCRLSEDGGKWRHSEALRRECLRAAVAAGVEFVDLEAPLVEEFPRQGSTRRIVSLHDFETTPDDLPGLVARLAAGADIVKLATTARNLSDTLRVLELKAPQGVPLIKLAMGERGLATRLLAPMFGSLWSYGCPSGGPPPAPGQVDIATMLGRYRYRSISPATRVFAVIGDPIAHSLSPLIHNAGFAARGLDDRVYIPLRVTAHELPWLLAEHRRWGLAGLSVTIPHKEAILEAAAIVDPLAKRAGAGNTLLFDPLGTRALNTDVPAAISSLTDQLGPDGLAGRTVLLLGAGGVCRGIAAGLLDHGAHVLVTGRTPSRAKALAQDLGCEALDWERRVQVDYDVLINGTPVGMSPQVDASPMPPEALRPEAVVFDTIYNPEHTRLLREAGERGCRTITGVAMFLRQAELQFQEFTGQAPPSAVLRQAFRQARAE